MTARALTRLRSAGDPGGPMSSPRPISPGELADIGEALFGDRWQRQLAEALGVNERTVRRWYAGTATPSPGVYRELLAIAEKRKARLVRAVGWLADRAEDPD